MDYFKILFQNVGGVEQTNFCDKQMDGQDENNMSSSKVKRSI